MNCVMPHDAQTDLLAAEARGEDLPFSILVVHASGSFDYGHFFRAYGRSFFETLGKEREVRNNG